MKQQMTSQTAEAARAFAAAKATFADAYAAFADAYADAEALRDYDATIASFLAGTGRV